MHQYDTRKACFGQTHTARTMASRAAFGALEWAAARRHTAPPDGTAASARAPADTYVLSASFNVPLSFRS